jgi:hypothetical protein
LAVAGESRSARRKSQRPVSCPASAAFTQGGTTAFAKPPNVSTSFAAPALVMSASVITSTSVPAGVSCRVMIRLPAMLDRCQPA